MYKLKINILSWNLCWEAMKASKSKNLDMRKCLINNKNVCKEKVVDKLKKIIIENNLNLLSFQEFNIMNELVNFKEFNNYHLVKGVSGKETAVSLFRRDLFRYINHEYGDLCGKNMGRTYLLLELFNKKTKEKTIFLNVHFPHKDSPFKGARVKAEEKMKNLIKKYKTYRIIIAGDHNYEYNMKSYKKFIKKKFFLDSDSKNTCCTPNTTKKPSLKYDIILDTKDNKIKYTFPKNPKNNKMFVSDHVPIIASVIY